jgi:phosphoribosyl-AMP cyclohydrolase
MVNMVKGQGVRSAFFLLLVKGLPIHSWTSIVTSCRTTSESNFQVQSTPFEVDYYDDSNNPYMDDQSSLRVPADTKLVLGLNKYSHDTALCAADANTGKVLFAMAKERLSRKKHDSGNVATLVEKCLECLDLDYDAITKVVMNNHHHRILPLEANRAHMEWESGLNINGGSESGYDDEENRLDGAEKVSCKS